LKRERLKQFGPVKGYLQQSSYRCAREIESECAKDDIPVLIGYSGGSVMATRICNEPLLRLGQDISLLVSIDGSPAGNMEAVGHNIKHIINIYDPSPWIFGGGKVDGWGPTPVDNYPINIPHLAFQSSKVVNDIICKAVGDL